MPDSNSSVYVVSISGGKCLENAQKDQGVCRLRKWKLGSDEQQWTVEHKEGDDSTVAFKSVLDQQYLAALEPTRINGGKVGVAEEVQWWTLEQGLGPGWVHVKSISSSDGSMNGYLNDEFGRMQDDNKIQTYRFESGNPGYNTFYIFPAVAADDKTGLAFSAMNDQSRGQKDLDARQQELDEKLQELDRRQEELNARQSDLDAKQRDSSERDAATEKSIAENAEALKEKANALAKREAELARRESELTAQQKSQGQATTENGSSQSDTNAAEKDLAARERAVNEREKSSKRREAELKAREAKLAEQPAAATKKDGSNGHVLCQNEILTLKVKIKELESQLHEGRVWACEHMIRPPPRKLDHKVVGFVYQ